MRGGIITAKKGVGDVYFLDNNGKEVITASKGVEVALGEEFSGFSVKDAIGEAKKYAIGAIQKKVAQKMRGHDCIPVVKDVRINYKIKYGFSGLETEEAGHDASADIARKMIRQKKS